jgi:hypothetical protein
MRRSLQDQSAITASHEATLADFTEDWIPGTVQELPEMPIKTPYKGDDLQRVKSEIDRAIQIAEVCGTVTPDDSQIFADMVRQMVEFDIERWQLRLVTDAWLTHQMKTEIIQPLQACRICWNEVDQNIFAFRAEVLHLIHSSMRLCFLSLDNHHAMAMHARRLIEAVFLACTHQLVIRFCYGDLEEALKRDIYGFVAWENLYNFASTSVGWSEKQRKAAKAFLGLSDASYADLLKDEFQIRGDRLGAMTMYFAQNWRETERSPSLCEEVFATQRCYQYLCKFVHVTPQSFRFPQTMHDDLDQSLVDKSVLVCAITAMFNATKILATLFFDTAFLKLRFQSLIERYCSESPNAKPLSIQDDLLPSILSGYRDVIIPNEEGDIVLHKVRSFSTEAERLARRFDALKQSDKVAVEEFVRSLRTATLKRPE